MNEPSDRESGIARGTILLRPAELAPRLGLGNGRSGRQLIIARARAGIYPHYRVSPKVYLFSWPAVLGALERQSRRFGSAGRKIQKPAAAAA